MINISGDFGELEGFAAKLESSPRVLSEIVAEMAAQSAKMVQNEFRSKQDPSGGGWASKTAGGRGRLMLKTGSLRSSIQVSGVSSTGFEISSGSPYIIYHQTGTSRMPARRVLPEDALPAKWDAAYAKIARKRLNEHFK